MVAPVIKNDGLVAVITFNRDSVDFTERERRIIKLLSPHIRRAYTRLSEERLSRPKNHSIKETTLLDDAIRMVSATEKALYWLRKYFTRAPLLSGQLPPEIKGFVRRLKAGFSSEEMIQGHLSPLVMGDKGGTRLYISLLPGKEGLYDMIRMEEAQMFPNAPSKEAGLTKRESHIISCIADGRTNLETAEILNISVRTVEKHLEQIYKKLGVDNMMAALHALKNTGVKL